MAIGVVHTVRNATATNTIGHSYALNTTPTPDEETYSDTRYYNSYDLSGGLTAGNYNGVTADGSITRAETVAYGDSPAIME